MKSARIANLTLLVAMGTFALSLSAAHAGDTILHYFAAGTTDGARPTGSLTLTSSTLFGTTDSGGSANDGTVFSVNTDGTGYSLLHSFTSSSTDGTNPDGSLTLAGSKLYGTTVNGGSSGLGTIFSTNLDGTGFSLLHSFPNTGGGTLGDYPYGSLTLSGSTLYGMTRSGGSGFLGTVFSMNLDGTGFGLLHSFAGGSADGANPEGSLTLSSSKVYGMTQYGGSANDGTIFSMNADGTGYSLLHSFTGGNTDGYQPYGSLTLSGSKLYGMTVNGGSINDGTVFSINLDGTGFTLLHSFVGGSTDGNQPHGSLTLSGSKLYGMTYYGGSTNNGTVFSINPDGTGFSVVQSFAGPNGDGAAPEADVTFSNDGQTLYGMTSFGGTFADDGVVFSIPTPTPEPSTGALLALACTFATLRRRPLRSSAE